MIDLKVSLPATSPPCWLRRATPGDEAFLRRLFTEDKAAELAATGLSSTEVGALVDMQYRARAAGYAAAFDDARSWIVEHGGQTAARLLEVDRGHDRYVIDIAVALEARRGRLATAMLSWLQTQAKAQALGVTARIYRHNQASRALFAKLGFQEACASDDPQVTAAWRC